MSRRSGSAAYGWVPGRCGGSPGLWPGNSSAYETAENRMKSYLTRIDEWLRTRLGKHIWKSWKTIGYKYRSLRKLGTSRAIAMRMANTRKGYRRSADSPIVKQAISKERLKEATSFLDYYLEVTAKTWKPPCTERYARCCERSGRLLSQSLLPDLFCQPMTCSSLGYLFSTSQPLSVTMTRSSIRTPNSPGR